MSYMSETDNPKKVEFEDVNKWENNWNTRTLFSDFNVRAILTHHDDLISNIDAMGRMSRKMTRNVGPEDEDWFIVENDSTGKVELYLKDSGLLVMWKLNDHDDFVELFDRVEQHRDDADEFCKDER